MSSHEEEDSLGDHPRMGTAVAPFSVLTRLLWPAGQLLKCWGEALLLGNAVASAVGKVAVSCCSRKEPTSLDGKSPIVSGSEGLLKKRANPYFDFSSINNCWLITNKGFLQSPVVIRTTAASRQGSEALPASCGSHPLAWEGMKEQQGPGNGTCLKTAFMENV